MNYKLSFVASLAIASAIGFAGCGSSGGGGDGSNTSSLSKISGIVSDGPIENAKVYLDENFNGEYDNGEPTTFTDKDGKYTLDIVPQDNMKYLLVAEGKAEYETKDLEDNPNNDGNLTFTMFSEYGSSSDINPTTLKTYLKSINAQSALIKNFVDSNETNNTKLFQDNIKDKQDSFSKVLKEIALELQSDVLFKDTKEQLSLNSDIGFSDQNLSELDAQFDNKVVSKIGNVVISKDLLNIDNEEVENIDDNITGITINTVKSTNNYYDGNSTNSPASLKKPIFSSISDKEDKVKLVVGKKTALGSDYTVSITPYDSILEIPAYDKIKGLGYSVVLGSHIVVQNSNGEKQAISTIKDQAVSGAVLHKNDGLSLADLKYLYFDGTNWVDENVAGSDTFNGLNNNFKLVPYVLVKSDTTQAGLDTITKTIVGLSNMSNPVVVAKGKAATSSAGKLLAKTVDSENIVLDASIDVSEDTVTFKIPKGYVADEFVILDENLKDLTTKPSISVKDGDDLTFEDGVFANSTETQELNGYLTANDFAKNDSLVFEAFTYYGNTVEEQELDDIMRENIKRFLLSSDDNSTINKFYTNDKTQISFEEEYSSNEDNSTLVYKTDCTLGTNVITCNATETDGGKIVETENYSYTFEPNKLTYKLSFSEDESYSGTGYSWSEKESVSGTVIYSRLSKNQVNASYSINANSSGSEEYNNEKSSHSGSENIENGIATITLSDTAEFAKLNSMKYNITRNVNGITYSGKSKTKYTAGTRTYIGDDDNMSNGGEYKFTGNFNLPIYSYNQDLNDSEITQLQGNAIVSGTFNVGSDYESFDNELEISETINNSIYKIDSKK